MKQALNSPSTNTQPIKCQEIITQIKKDILLQTYGPGDVLPREEQLAKDFKVGRALVREALGVLKTQGYLRAKRGSKGGTFVCDLLQSRGMAPLLADLILMRSMTIKDLCDARLLIEPEAARMAALNADSSQIDTLKTLVGKSKAAHDTAERINFDVEFHKKICQASGNPFFALLIQNMMEFLKHFLAVLDEQPTYIHDPDIHNTLCEAIAFGDHQQAHEQMFAHMVTMKQRFCSLEKEFLEIQSKKLYTQ